MDREFLYQEFLKLSEKLKKWNVELFNLNPNLFNVDEQETIKRYILENGQQ